MVLANRQQVVVGVDGSETSAAAARWAADLAARLHSPLHIVSAVREPTFYLAEEAIVVPVEVWNQQKLSAEQIVGDLSESLVGIHPHLAVSTEVGSTSAAALLTECSRTARLVVVGNSGSGAISSFLLGSTAKAVAHDADCPVVVWRESHLSFDAPVVVGVDGGATSESAIGHAFEVASALGVALIAVHSWNPVSKAGGVALPGFVDWAACEREEAALLSESAAGWAEKYPDVQVEYELRQGNSSHILVEHSMQSQLVIVGSHGRGSIASLVLGSTGATLVHHAHCPVMICRGGR
jgi:nucleotide-binding universal stress UspA family protein